MLTSKSVGLHFIQPLKMVSSASSLQSMLQYTVRIKENIHRSRKLSISTDSIHTKQLSVVNQDQN